MNEGLGMGWSLVATRCLLADGRRAALLGSAGVDAAGARLLGPGAPAEGLAVESLPAWGDWRMVGLPDAPGSWRIRSAGAQTELSIAAWPATLQRAHLVHFGHSDFGWADLPDRMRAIFVQDLDLAIAACEATAGRLDGERFAWNIEIAALVEDWLACRRPADHARLAALVRAGRIEIGAFSRNVVLDACDAEEVMRLCDLAAVLAARLGGSIHSAHHIDVPGLHPRLAAAMAAAGVRYLTWGANSHMALDFDACAPRCLRWRPDGRHEVQVWRHTQNPHLGAYASGGKILGALDQSPSAAAIALLRWLADATAPELPVALVTLGADFARPTPQACDLVAWWNRHVALPRLRLSTNAQAHRDIEQSSGERLPVVQGQYPSAWANLALGVPDLSALCRRTSLGLRRAEQVSAWRGLCGAGTSELDPARISEDLLRQYEHTYGLEGYCDRYEPATLDDITQTAGPLRRADEALRTAAWRDVSALSRRFAAQGDGPTILVLNHLPRTVSAAATARVHVRHLRHRAGWQVRDLATGELVPHQLDRPLKDPPNYHQTTHRHLYDLHFLAGQVPPLGYKLFRLEATDSPPPAAPAAQWIARPGGDPAARLEWGHGQLDIDQATGAILAWRCGQRSILPAPDMDRPLLGECRLVGFAQSCARPKDFTDNDRFYRITEVLRPRLEQLEPLAAGPVFGGYAARATLGREARITLQVRAFVHAPWLDVELLAERPGGLDIEALALAFPADIARPKFAFDGGGLTVDALADLAPGAYRDHLAADRWAAVHGEQGALVVCGPDAPIVSLGGLHSLRWHRAWPEPLAAELWSVLSLNGHWKCGNVTRRNRESARWRFRVCPMARFDPLAAQAAGDEAAFPLTAEVVESSDADAPFTAAQGSLLTIQEDGRPVDAGVQLLCLRPTPGGVFLRLAERAGRSHALRLASPLRPGMQAMELTLAPHAVAAVDLAIGG